MSTARDHRLLLEVEGSAATWRVECLYDPADPARWCWRDDGRCHLAVWADIWGPHLIESSIKVYVPDFTVERRGRPAYSAAPGVVRRDAFRIRVRQAGER